MKNLSKVALAAGGAAVVLIGGSAFTAANSVPTAAVQGYGETSVTGVEIATMAVNPLAANPANLNTVVYTAADDMTDDTFVLTVNPGGTQTTITCTDAFLTATTTITCTASQSPAVLIHDISGLGLSATGPQTP